MRVQQDMGDGTFIVANLTDEGVIVDRYDNDGNPLVTFGQMYDEIVPLPSDYETED